MIHKPDGTLFTAKFCKNFQGQHKIAQEINYASENREGSRMAVFKNLKLFFAAGMASQGIASVHKAVKMDPAAHKNWNQRKSEGNQSWRKIFMPSGQKMTKNEPAAAKKGNHQAHEWKRAHHVAHIFLIPFDTWHGNCRKHAER